MQSALTSSCHVQHGTVLPWSSTQVVCLLKSRSAAGAGRHKSGTG